MKKLNFVIVTALAVCFLGSCKDHANGGDSSTEDTNATADVSNVVPDTSIAKDTSSKTKIKAEKGDIQFAIDAASGGVTEVELGRLAQKKGYDPRVKNFGAMMVKDHSKANDELQALAKAKNITLPASVLPADQKVIDELTTKEGRDFDRMYVKDMIDDHKNDIKTFEHASKNCQDPDIKAFASKTLPVLRNHLDAINTIKEGM
jgi:putative membrane protein